MGNLNVLTLLTDRLLLHASYLSLATYNVLFEMLIEQMTPLICYTPHEKLTGEERFENPILLKVIANLISQSEKRPELLKVGYTYMAILKVNYTFYLQSTLEILNYSA